MVACKFLNGAAPGKALFQPAGEAGKGVAENEVDDGDEDENLGWESHCAVIDLGGNVVRICSLSHKYKVSAVMSRISNNLVFWRLISTTCYCFFYPLC